MSVIDIPAGGPPEPPPGEWSERVRYSRRAGGYAYHPDRLLCRADAAGAAVDDLRTLLPAGSDRAVVSDPDPIGLSEWAIIVYPEETVGPVDAVVEELRARGHRVEPDYVLFANPMFANPMFANPMFANPMFANPMFANPMFANPMFANPMFANPMFANTAYSSPVIVNPVFANPSVASGYQCTGERPSTARPAAEPDRTPPEYAPQGADGPRVVILDTGIAGRGCPPLLALLSQSAPKSWHETANTGVRSFLDPAAGHGTFIAGLIQSLAPDRPILPVRVVSPFGDVTVSHVVDTLDWLIDTQRLGHETVVNMSFGGYADEDMAALSSAVRRVLRTGAAVVASAGNDATDRPLFPACLPDVVAVAALGPYGPAPFTNYGAWVDACAPGTDLVGMFFRFNGEMEMPKMPGAFDPDKFEHWARWSGTSFAAPIVTAAVLRHMVAAGVDAKQAVADVVDAPALFRLPGLGTVVNLAPSDLDCVPFERAADERPGNDGRTTAQETVAAEATEPNQS